MENFNESMENLIVEDTTQSFSEVTEGGLAGDLIIMNTGIETIRSSLILIVNSVCEKVIKVRGFRDVVEKVEQEKAGRIIAGWPEVRVSSGDDGANKGKINHRGDQSWVTTLDATL